MFNQVLLRGVIFCLAFGVLIPAAAESTVDPEYEIKFERLFQQAMIDYRIPGAAYAIVRGQSVTSMHTFGVRGEKDRRTVNTKTRFRLASVSKTFSAELAAILVEQGVLNWHEPIINYIPEFQLKQQGQAEAVTVQHILSHSSGLMPNAFDGYLKGNFRFERIIPKFAALQPYCEPGSCYGYQNILFSFIEEVVERKTGQAYSQLLESYIFSPLSMEQASVGYDAFVRSENRAHPHIKASRKGPWHQVRVSEDFYKVESAAGVNASIEDMSKWLIAQMGHRPEVISTQVLNKVREPQVLTKPDLKRRRWRDILDTAHYGTGWRVYQQDEQTLYYHSGWVQGFRAAIAYSNDHQIGMVLLVNAESAAVNDLSASFWRLLLEHTRATESHGANKVAETLSQR